VDWNGSDLSISNEDPSRPGPRDLRVVDGIMYGHDPETPDRCDGLGSPDSIDPGSRTTPDDYLAAVRDNTAGETGPG
jgi:hypothetical protein